MIEKDQACMSAPYEFQTSDLGETVCCAGTNARRARVARPRFQESRSAAQCRLFCEWYKIQFDQNRNCGAHLCPNMLGSRGFL